MVKLRFHKLNWISGQRSILPLSKNRTLVLTGIIIALIILYFIFNSRKNEKENYEDRPISFEESPDLGKEENENVKQLLNKKYHPRTGYVELDIVIKNDIGLRPGDELEIIFKSKEAYFRNIYLEIGFKHRDKLIATLGEVYDDPSPVIRIIRAHFSGIESSAIIKEVESIWVTVGIQFLIDGQQITSKVKRGKSLKYRGEFNLTGYHHLPEEVKKIVWKKLKEEDRVKLIPDETNNHDREAIKVLFNDVQIGWVSREYSGKRKLFNALKEQKEIVAHCKSNYRASDTIRVSKPDAEGKWNDKYLGMAQFVTVKFEYNKD